MVYGLGNFFCYYEVSLLAVSRFFFIYFTVTVVKKIVRYIEDL